MSDIKIKEVVEDNESGFNVKRFKLSGLKINGPIKTIDTKGITKELLKEEMKKYKKMDTKFLLETSKSFRINSIESLTNETDKTKIKNKFYYKNYFSDFPNIITPKFNFNPYKNFENLEEISNFYDYYYCFSDTALFVPNLRLKKNLYKENKDGALRKTGVKKLTKLEDYKRFVKESFEILNFKNNKPIFVPISLKLSIGEIKELAKFYSENEFYNIWLDFQSASTADPTKQALLRNFIRNFEEKERLIVHSTNIKREIISHREDLFSPGSDILTPILGPNIIGVNKEPSFPINNKENLSYQEKKELKRHKARIFEKDSYYYKKVSECEFNNDRKERLMKEKPNITYNARKLNEELISQRNEFLKEMTIKPYVSNKKMLNEYKNGDLKKNLFKKIIKKTTMDDFI